MNHAILDHALHNPGFVYVATPYSRYRLGHDLAAHHAAMLTAKLMEGGINAYSPIVHGHHICRAGNLRLTGHEFWMAIDEPFMRAATALVVMQLQGWDTSDGVEEERRRFLMMDKPIFYIQPHDLIEEFPYVA